METIVVEIFLPAISQSYDFIMPVHVPVGSIIKTLIDVVASCTGSALIDGTHPCLCDMTARRPIPPEKTLAQCGIRDSARLMLL